MSLESRVFMRLKRVHCVLFRCCLPAAYVVTGGLAAEIISLSENALMRVPNNSRREERYIFRIVFICVESYSMNSNDSNYFISIISRITDPNAQHQPLGKIELELGP